ncbi:hypothetical protein [Apilactobacillus xinyiensis]|uniref:hypothetical protein n=1 Tax=Apilactobacillus xinyiensis TaxID=2841032 RepID=UPI001C7DA529|nr:hypothetical protein [Apilactobacillus xinyiensis]
MLRFSKFRGLIILSMFALFFTCCTFKVNADVKDANNVHSKSFTKHFNRFNKLASKLLKQGYVYCIDKKAFFGKNTYPVISYSDRDKKIVVDKKIRFKIKHIWSYKNGISVNVVSKNKKYYSLVNFPTGIYDVYSRDKKLAPIVTFANKIFYKKVKNNHYNLEKLNSMANNVKSDKKRKLAKQFVKQFDYFLLAKGDLNTVPYFFIGNLN